MAEIAPVAALPAADPAQRAKIEKVSQEFEGAFLQVMLGQMFKDVSAGQFGGGSGEDAFKSFMTDAFAKSMAQRGGVGRSDDLTRHMLKMQGLS